MIALHVLVRIASNLHDADTPLGTNQHRELRRRVREEVRAVEETGRVLWAD